MVLGGKVLNFVLSSSLMVCVFVCVWGWGLLCMCVKKRNEGGVVSLGCEPDRNGQ